MHKGNRYLLEPRARPWMRDDFPSFWAADEYEGNDLDWYLHTGAAAPSSHQGTIRLRSISYSPPIVTYYTSFTWNSQDVRFGFQIGLKPDHTQPYIRGYLTVAGVDQISASAFQPFNEDWQGIPQTVITWNPSPGAILGVDFDSLQAVGY